MKVRSNLLSDTGYNKSIHIMIAGKKKQSAKITVAPWKQNQSLETKEACAGLKAFLKGLF